MAWKARKTSETIVPINVDVGPHRFTVETRYITPKHMKDITDACTTRKLVNGRYEEVTDNLKFADLLFEAAVVRVVGLTPIIVEQMLEFEPDSDAPPVDADGTITNREFIKFLWIESPTRHFFSQVNDGLNRALEIAALERELRQKNSASSPEP